MQNFKSFRKGVRIELGHVCHSIKRLEFMATRLRGPLKRKIRKELQALKETRAHIMQCIQQLKMTNKPMCINSALRIKEEIARMREGCQALKAQLR